MKKCLLIFIACLTIGILNAQSVVEIKPGAIGPFCPKTLVKGDRDFSGRGPEIWASAKLTFNRNAVLIMIQLRAKELKGGDDSETKGTSLKVLYNAPTGFYISEIMSGKSAEVHYVSKPGITKFKPGGLASALSMNASSSSITDKNDELVAMWDIYGDTNGQDISDDDDFTDDTRITVVLNTIKVKLMPTAASQGISTVQLETIDEWLCPNRLTRGDREFDGHGPRIKSEVKLRIGPGGRSLLADITFSATETQHDWSTTEGKWTKTVYEAPYGKKITEIMSDKASRTQFISPPGGFQFLVPGNDVRQAVSTFFDNMTIEGAVMKAFGLDPNKRGDASKLVKGLSSSGNTMVQVPAVEGALVKYFYIVGDTGGADISDDNNCNDDTRIVKIEFFPVRVKMVASND